jgi:hypothetical protein
MLTAIVRVLFGFAMACFAAGVTKMLFAVAPRGDLSTDPDNLMRLLILSAQFATVFAIFASFFALLAAVISEWQGLRGLLFHSFVGLAIAAAGFGAQYFGEAPNSSTIFNNYAFGAYAATGLVGGFVYWLFAGRHAGSEDDIYDPVPPSVTAPRKAPPAPGPRKTPAAPPPQMPTPAAKPEAQSASASAIPIVKSPPVKPQ